LLDSAVERRNERIGEAVAVVVVVASDEAVAAAVAGTAVTQNSKPAAPLPSPRHHFEAAHTDAVAAVAAAAVVPYYSRCDSIVAANQTVALVRLPSRFVRTRFGRCAWR